MGQFFSDKTEEAVKLIYTGYAKDDFNKAANLLTQASNEGDADAFYFLHRCLLGKEFVWEYANFEYNKDKSMEMLKRSIIQGSHLGALGALRLGELETMNPNANKKDEFNAVLKMAEAGEPFCQYLIGTVYYWEDIYEIEDHLPHPLFNPIAYEALAGNDDERIKKMNKIDSEVAQKAIYWYEKCAQSRYTWCLTNLVNIYENGRGGIPANKDKHEKLLKTFAAAGNPVFENLLAFWYYDRKQYKEALEYYKSSAEKGHLDSYHSIGAMYKNGEGVTEDGRTAFTFYLKAADGGVSYSMRTVGFWYFYGTNTEVDYARAFYYLERACSEGEKDAYNLLGLCFLKGLGTNIDYKQAKFYFENGNCTDMSLNGLGQIYADGLGVPEDIQKGISYFEQAGDEEAKGHIARFKKNIFGKWKRR